MKELCVVYVIVVVFVLLVIFVFVGELDVVKWMYGGGVMLVVWW